MDVQLQAVNNSHRAKWGNVSPYTGYFVEYHYFIGRDGTVVNTRDERERTGHTRNETVNDHSIAVVLAGDFNTDELTTDQAHALRDLMLQLKRRYPSADLIGHRDASPTACPGAKILKLLDAAKPSSKP